ncbi:MAG TPA: alpha/beta hydrolase-fold protein, partial [Aggregatilineales bacterium]|nr:alpha/beta hydrolase-fold protein [Aggregatilineales bacterium]
MHRLVKLARESGTPVFDGEEAIFIWQGSPAPTLIGDFNDWGRAGKTSMTHFEDDIWVYAVKLPGDAYIEYAYMRDDQRITDPFNSRLTTNGVDADNNFFFMPGGEVTPLARKLKPSEPHGTLTRYILHNPTLLVGGNRRLTLYRPAGGGRCPLVIVLDGQDYLARAHLPRIVDHLIAQRRIRPIALATVDHGRSARFMEYACSEATLAFLLKDVLDFTRRRVPLLDLGENPGAHGILGASMGGLMATYAGLRAPEIFGHVISQSGAFGFELKGHDSVIFDLIRDGAVRPTRLWL